MPIPRIIIKIQWEGKKGGEGGQYLEVEPIFQVHFNM